MKKILLAFVVLAFAGVGVKLVATSSAQRSVPFAVYNSYFVRNDAGLPVGRVNLVLSSQGEFDRIFSPAAVMGNNSFLPPETFAHHLVAATILRGTQRSYKVKQVSVANQKLSVVYTVQKEAPSSATFASPLIVALEEGNYTSVEFVENGTMVKTISLRGSR